MKSPSRAWLGGFATQALSQAVGTLLAALVVVLGGAAFGYFKNLSGGELVAIALTALGLIGGLGLASALWQTRAYIGEMRERAERRGLWALYLREIAEQLEAENREARERGDR